MIEIAGEAQIATTGRKTMMDELVNTVTQKTGLSPDQAQSAVDSVLEFLKQRLPAPLASHLDSLISGQPGGGEGLASKAGAALGNLFGGKS
ncbi:MAG: hypothetical protein ABI165_20530 [Bryobacteraceae bacterium]